jgi:glycosyltransferase involved in cell wall biosynthesis
VILVKSEFNLKISIITVCFNSATTIENTVVSVAGQKNVGVEHIIVDGASTDGTIDIVNKYKSISKFISEPDRGIYDAMNKGIALATGDVIGTLNADDFYANDNVLEDVAQIFLDTNVDACYGDLVYVSQENTNNIVRYWKSRNYVSGLFKSGWMPAHPTFFVRKGVYERLGSFDLNYKIAADFEILFRFIEQYKITTKYIPKVLVIMRLGGTTNKNLSNIFRQNKEIITILNNCYVDFSIVKFVFRKLFNRFFQFIDHPKN